jgi:hypothetical protein
MEQKLTKEIVYEMFDSIDKNLSRFKFVREKNKIFFNILKKLGISYGMMQKTNKKDCELPDFCFFSMNIDENKIKELLEGLGLQVEIFGRDNDSFRVFLKKQV